MATAQDSYYLFHKKWSNPGLFFVFILGLFKQTIQFLKQITVKNGPSSILRRDSNPQPLNHESSPITTIPGLPAVIVSVWIFFRKKVSTLRPRGFVSHVPLLHASS